MLKKPNHELAEEIFKKYEDIIFKVANNILHNRFDAEDAVQETFVRIIGDLDRVRGIPENERIMYFTAIAEHISIDMLRKKKKRPTVDIDELYDIASEEDVENKAIQNAAVEEIKKALLELSDMDFALLNLFLFQDKSCREVGEALNIPEKNVRTYVHRAKKRLLKILKKRGGYDENDF